MADVGNALIRVELAEQYLRKQLSDLKNELKGIKDVVVNANDGGSFARLIAGVDKFQQEVAEASQYVQGLSAAANQLGQLAGALQSASGSAFDATKELNSAQTAVSTLTDDTDKFTASSAQLAKDLGYQSNTADILAASYDVLSSGFTNVTDVTEVMKASTYAAIGGFTEVSVATDALTSVMNAYGQSTYEASRVADILIATQNAGKITVAQYGSLIGRVASTAAQAGVSLEELSGFVANATVKGVKSGAAIDGLRQAMANVLKPTKMAADEAARLGIEFNESALKSKGLKGILQDIAATGDTSNGTLIKLFGTVEAVAALTPSAGENLGSLQKQIDYITNSTGEAEKGFNKVSASIEGQLTSASNQGKEALAALGQGAAAVILPIAGVAVKAIEAFNGLPEPIKTGAGALLTVATAAVTAGAAVTGLLAVVPVVTAGWSALGTVLTGATVAQTAVTVATEASSVATTSAAVATPQLTAAMTQATVAATGLAVAETAANAQTSGLADSIENVVDPLQNATSQLSAAKSEVSAASSEMLAGTTKAASGTQALAAGSSTASAATVGLRASLAGLASSLSAVLVPLALVAAGIAAAKGVWEAASARFGKGEAASGVNAAVEALGKIDPAAVAAAASVETVNDRFGILKGTISEIGKTLEENGGVFGAVAAGLDQLANKLNLPFDIYTAKQIDAQQATIAFEQVVNVVGDRLDKGRAILEQYGQAAGDASKRTKLSAESAAEFATKAKQQTDALDTSIEALKKVKPADDTHNASLQANIKLLTQQRDTLISRTQALGIDKAALEENANATQFLTDKIAKLADAYKESADASDLGIEKQKAGILDAAVSAGKSADDVQKAITESERQGLEARIKIAGEKTKELQALLSTTTDPAKIKEVQTEIAKIEADSFRDRQALANSVLQERQETENKAAEAAKELVQEQKRAAEESARAAEESAREQKRVAEETAREQAEAARKAAEATKKALEDMVNKSDTAYQLQTGKLKNALEAQLVALKEQQANGDLTKEQAEARKRQIVQESLKAELDENAKAVEAVKALRAKGAIDEEELQKRLLDLESNATQIRGQIADGLLAEQDRKRQLQEQKAKETQEKQVQSAKEGAKGEIDTSKERLEEEKKLRDEQVKLVEDAYRKQVQIAKVNALEEIAALKQSQASGDISSEDADSQESAIRDRALKSELDAIRKQQREIAKLKRQGALIDAEADQKLLELREQRANLETQIAQSAIDKQTQAEQRATEEKQKLESEKAKAAEESARLEQEAKARAEESKRKEIERTQAAQELAQAKLKTSVLEEAASAYKVSAARREDKEQLQARLEQIERQGLERSKQLIEQELSATTDLEQRGVLAAEDATKRKEQLRQELAQISIEQSQAENRAEEVRHQAELERIDERAKYQQQVAQQQIAQQELASQGLGLEQQNLSSLVDLSKARNSLEAQRLDYQLKDAKTDQEKLVAQQAINRQKVASLVQEQQFAREQLELEIQQRNIELQQKAIAAESAVIEAQLAIEKAKASGASATELGLLQTQLGLREQQRDMVAVQAKFNDEILNSRLKETQALKQQEDLEAAQRSARESISQYAGQELPISQISDSLAFGGPIPQMPNQAIQQLGAASDNINSTLSKLSQQLGASRCSPENVTVVTRDPVADLSQVLNQLAKP